MSEVLYNNFTCYHVLIGKRNSLIADKYTVHELVKICSFYGYFLVFLFYCFMCYKVDNR